MPEDGLDRSSGLQLLPIEDELNGKTAERLEQLYADYEQRMERVKGPDEVWVLQRFEPFRYQQIQILSRRAQAIRFYANILRTMDILQNPNSSAEEQALADKTIWNVKVLKQIAAHIVANPAEQTTTEQAEFAGMTAHDFAHTWSASQVANMHIIQQVLEETPFHGHVARIDEAIICEPFDI